MINLSSYKNKKVFITGHTGFKGSWLGLWLNKLGAEIKGYALEPDTKPNHFDLLKLNIDSEINNINDGEALKLSIQTFQPEIIFHLAAQPLVIASYQNPVETFKTNVMGTLNVLEAARTCKAVKAIVVVTTDKVYENKEQDEGYIETDNLGGNDPYSASKACAEIVTKSYSMSFFNPSEQNALVASVRSGNVIGGGDWAKFRLVPDIIRAVIDNQNLEIRYPNSTRPWQHVLDCLYGYLLLGEKLLEGKKEYTGSWNFGPIVNLGIPVQEIIKMASEYFPNVQLNINFLESLHESEKLQLDAGKARQKLGWEPLYNDRSLFTETFKWYNDYYTKGEVNSHYILDQYLGKLKTMNHHAI